MDIVIVAKTMMTMMTTMTNLRTFVMLKYCSESNVCYRKDSSAPMLKCIQEDSADTKDVNDDLGEPGDDLETGNWGEMDCGDEDDPGNDLGDWGEIDPGHDEVLNRSYDQYLKTVEQGPVCVDDNNDNIEDSAISVDKIWKDNDYDDHEDSKNNDDDEHEDSKDNDDDDHEDSKDNDDDEHEDSKDNDDDEHEHEDSLDDNDFRTRQWTVELVIRRGVINKKLRQYIYKTMKQKNKQPAQYIMSTSWATVRCAPRVENSV